MTSPGEFRKVRSRIRHVFREGCVLDTTPCGYGKSCEAIGLDSGFLAEEREKTRVSRLRSISEWDSNRYVCRAYVTLARYEAARRATGVVARWFSRDFTYRRVLPRNFLMQHASRWSVSQRRRQPACVAIYYVWNTRVSGREMPVNVDRLA